MNIEHHEQRHLTTTINISTIRFNYLSDHQLIIPSEIFQHLIQEQTFLRMKQHSSSNFQTNSSERFFRALEKIFFIETKKRFIHSFEQEKQSSNQLFIQKSFH